MRTGLDQLRPSDDLEKYMSLPLAPEVPQLLRAVQEGQATKTTPEPSISAEGSGSARKLPEMTLLKLAVAIVRKSPQVAPPLVERKETMLLQLASQDGTMTTPFGCTTGCPPRLVTCEPLLVVGTLIDPHVLDINKETVQVCRDK